MFPLLQDSPRGLKVLEKRSLTGLQNMWPEQKTGWLNERLKAKLGFFDVLFPKFILNCDTFMYMDVVDLRKSIIEKGRVYPAKSIKK